jgi:hypothetical protein
MWFLPRDGGNTYTMDHPLNGVIDVEKSISLVAHRVLPGVFYETLVALTP